MYIYYWCDCGKCSCVTICNVLSKFLVFCSWMTWTHNLQYNCTIVVVVWLSHNVGEDYWKWSHGSFYSLDQHHLVPRLNRTYSLRWHHWHSRSYNCRYGRDTNQLEWWKPTGFGSMHMYTDILSLICIHSYANFRKYQAPGNNPQGSKHQLQQFLPPNGDSHTIEQ